MMRKRVHEQGLAQHASFGPGERVASGGSIDRPRDGSIDGVRASAGVKDWLPFSVRRILRNLDHPDEVCRTSNNGAVNECEWRNTLRGGWCNIKQPLRAVVELDSILMRGTVD